MFFFRTMTKQIHISRLTNRQADDIYVFGNVKEMIEKSHFLSPSCWCCCTVLQQHQHDRHLRVVFKHNEFNIPIVLSTNRRVGDWYMIFFVSFLNGKQSSVERPYGHRWSMTLISCRTKDKTRTVLLNTMSITYKSSTQRIVEWMISIF